MIISYIVIGVFIGWLTSPVVKTFDIPTLPLRPAPPLRDWSKEFKMILELSEQTAKRWEEVLVAYPVGHQFLYLGREMTVVSYRSGLSKYEPRPSMCAEYVDNRGIIRQHFFSTEMASLLLPSTKTQISKL